MVEEEKEEIKEQKISSETMPEIKLFGRWSYENIEIRDPGLKPYIRIKPIYIPHTFGRHEKVKFGKANVPIVERLINRLLAPGREKGLKKIGKEGGKKFKAMKIVEQAFKIIEAKTGENPIQVLVRAVENTAPREETIEIRQGGVVRRYSVDVSPQRRVDLALKFLVTGARQRAWRSALNISECLADELILASRGSFDSYAVRRRVEIERIAEASR